MSILGAVGVCTYNGINLNQAETLTTGYSQKPVYDAARRTVVYLETTLTIRFVVYSALLGGVDANINAMKNALMRPAGALDWSSKGGGTLQANLPGGAAKDVNYGPMPQSFRIVGTPHQLKTECEWSVLVSLPECQNAVYQGMPLELNYELAIIVDESGWSTRTYTGHLVIPATRSSVTSTKLQDNADLYLNQLVPASLPGFRRQSQPRKLNYAKTRLDLTVVDTEMATNIPPTGTIDCKASMELSSAGGKYMTVYNGTLTADYELAKGTTADGAFQAFLALWEDRRAALEQFLQNLQANPPAGAAAAAGKPAVAANPGGFKAFLGKIGNVLGSIDPAAAILLRQTGLNGTKNNGGANTGTQGGAGQEESFLVRECGFSASEPDIYGKPHARFTLNFAVWGSFGFVTGGLFCPVPGSNWQTWSQSIPAFKNRGTAGLTFQNSQDAIIDLCLQPPSISKLTSIQQPKTTSTLKGFPTQSPVPPTLSYMQFENAIFEECNDGTIGHRPLLSQSSPSTGGLNTPSGVPTTVIQQRNVSSMYVIMIGSATRLAYPIIAPTLTAVGSVIAIPANRPGDGFIQAITGNMGAPVYSAQWKLRYMLPQTPATITPPPHPYFSTIASNSSGGTTSTLSRGS